MIRSRIAPTPSGYLHIGNALNFVLTYALVRRSGGSLRLRIDDIDAPRARPGYVDDIFQTLEWLGIAWDEGPHTPAEHHLSFSQSLRVARYQEIIHQLNNTGRTYACTCSRQELNTCSCRSRKLPLDTPNAAIRIATPHEPIIVQDEKLGSQAVSLQEHMPDFVIRRRDGIAAYQLASLADDIDYGISLIVRGEDLLPSSAAQLYLASLIHADSFLKARFYHHALLLDADGAKLSKSEGSLSLRAMRLAGAGPERVFSQIGVALQLGSDCRSLADILELWPG